MNQSYKTCRNHESLFLKLGNHESLYFGSGIMNNESLRKAQQNRRMNYGMQDMAFPRVQISIFLGGGGSMPPDPLYNSCVRATVRLFLQWRWCLKFSNKKLVHIWAKGMMILRNSGQEIYIILDETEVWTAKKIRKTRQNSPWEIHFMNKLVIKCLRKSWIWKKILVGIMNHWGNIDRNHEYQDSNDSASTPETNSINLMSIIHNIKTITWCLRGVKSQLEKHYYKKNTQN